MGAKWFAVILSLCQISSLIAQPIDEDDIDAVSSCANLVDNNLIVKTSAWTGVAYLTRMLAGEWTLKQQPGVVLGVYDQRIHRRHQYLMTLGMAIAGSVGGIAYVNEAPRISCSARDEMVVGGSMFTVFLLGLAKAIDLGRAPDPVEALTNERKYHAAKIAGAAASTVTFVALERVGVQIRVPMSKKNNVFKE